MIENRTGNQTYIFINHKVIKSVNHIIFEIKSLFEPAFIPQKAICIPFNIPSIVFDTFSGKTTTDLVLKEVLKGIREALTLDKINNGETVIHNKNVYIDYLKYLLELFGIINYELKFVYPRFIESEYLRYIHWEVSKYKNGPRRKLSILLNNSIDVMLVIADDVIELRMENGLLIVKAKDDKTNEIDVKSYSPSEFFERFIENPILDIVYD